ncbi:MAG: hypothetical protein JEZ00_01855 [Anaerolineaceae bacterium]|nr:hypothetical protein [Anaerolineaceae bacterium]
MSFSFEVEKLPSWMALIAAEGVISTKDTEEVLQDNGVNALLDELSGWEDTYLDSHKKSQHLLHKATFLVDIGITIDEPRMRSFIELVHKHISTEGILETRIKTYERFGGSGQAEWHWMLCDAPLLTYIAITSGGLTADQAKPAVEYMISLRGEEGWLCKVDPNMGKFRGPGGAKLICPYATLLMLKLLALFPEYHHSEEVHHGINAILRLWDDRKARKPFLFAMGTDFQKVKAPLIWYDILHVLDVLTQFEWARSEAQIVEMAEILRRKQNENGLFVPESIYMPWKQWEFGQKKVPSMWVSYLAHRILIRMR